MAMSQSTVDWLNKKGHDTIHLRNEGLQTLSDIEIYNKAKQENRIILTCDLDFGTILAFSKSILPSIIIFRLSNELPINIQFHLDKILNSQSESLDRGCIIISEDNRFRVRQLPI
jgi:predicted nuclease of predicted toxin-antitoxin system